jgi:hypothetical protein
MLVEWKHNDGPQVVHKSLPRFALFLPALDSKTSPKLPPYALNSLMLHGLIFAQKAKNLDRDPGNDSPDEVHDYFGTGTQLQEMYIRPSLLMNETGMCWRRPRSGRGPIHLC